MFPSVRRQSAESPTFTQTRDFWTLQELQQIIGAAMLLRLIYLLLGIDVCVSSPKTYVLKLAASFPPSLESMNEMNDR
jgi:hypothetical protein